MKAIVYTSNTGFTKEYAEMLKYKLSLPLFDLDEAKKNLEKGTEIIYMGWLFASSVKGYKKASRRYKVKAVCGVGLADTGCLLEEVRKAISLPESVPLFTIQGGMRLSKLKGINKSMIKMLTKVFLSKKNPTDEDKRMVELLTTEASYVKEENLSAFLEWYENAK